jgi:cation diffusion facilitator family transporter
MAGSRGGENRKTVLVALAANLAITVVKGVAGATSGSSALLAEAAHSIADTANQGLMLVSLSRSERPPDEAHPFGYGKERFFWVLLAAIVIFLSGGVFSILEGLYRIFLGGADKGGYLVTYGALGFALLAEGTSLVRAVRQTRSAAREAGVGLVPFVRISKEPAVKTVVSEDSAAVAGVVIALVGTALHQLTGQKAFDGAAAVAIGALLCFVGYALGRDTKGLLIGEPARPDERDRLRRTILEHDGVDEVVELRTMYVGPHSLLVVAKLDVRDELDGAAIERLASEIDEALREELPDVAEVFLDPTSGTRPREPARPDARSGASVP